MFEMQRFRLTRIPADRDPHFMSADRAGVFDGPILLWEMNDGPPRFGQMYHFSQLPENGDIELENGQSETI